MSLGLSVGCLMGFVGCQEAAAPGPRLNEIQLVGSHNSYKQSIDPALLQQIANVDPALAESLDYRHIGLVEQLDLGLRNLELDLYYDPAGGRFATPLGLKLITDARPYDPEGLMQTPGFKVFHVQDIDFRSSCLTLVLCLDQIKQWSQAHPDHSPVIVTVNAKDDIIDRAGFTQPLPFGAKAWQALDNTLRAVLKNRLFMPDDLRGQHHTLLAAIDAEGWPKMTQLRGKFLFVLDESSKKMAAYMAGHAALKERVMFVNAAPGTAAAAIRVINNPLTSFDEIRNEVKRGYMVRTRADAGTIEARKGDSSRREAAFASGAQIITTDFYLPATRFGNDYQVRLAGTHSVWRCNPVIAAQCVATASGQ